MYNNLVAQMCTENIGVSTLYEMFYFIETKFHSKFYQPALSFNHGFEMLSDSHAGSEVCSVLLDLISQTLVAQIASC